MKYTMSNYKILDNVLTENTINCLYDMINDEYFPWYFTKSIFNRKIKVDKDTLANNITYSPGFHHTPFSLESGWQSSLPIIDNMKTVLNEFAAFENITIDRLLRVRIRKTLQFPTHKKDNHNMPHTDFPNEQKYYSLIYYPEDTDGDTVFFKGNKQSKEYSNMINSINGELVRVQPKKGRFIFFDGSVIHSGNNPISYNKRVVVNYDFTIKETEYLW